MHLLLPALVRLFRPDVSDAPLDIRHAAVKTLTRLLPLLQAGFCLAYVYSCIIMFIFPSD